MLHYGTLAKTVKDLDVFNYSLYSVLALNMLKYNHDSSASIRLLSALIDSTDAVIEDVGYVPRFGLTGLEFINIDRINGFYISSIANFTKENKENYLLAGYSRYIDEYFILKRVENFNDFIRHSIPVDAFFSALVASNNPVDLSIQPNVKVEINLRVKNSRVSITPVAGFFTTNKDDYNSPIAIRLFGKNIHNEDIVEDVNIEINIDTFSENEFSVIEYVMLMNAVSSVDIILSPYITGVNQVWDKIIADREELDIYPCIVNVDKDKKQICFNNLSPDFTIYPRAIEIMKTVDLDLEEDEDIIDYYVDVANRLVYVTTTKTVNNDDILVAMGPEYWRYDGRLVFASGEYTKTVDGIDSAYLLANNDVGSWIENFRPTHVRVNFTGTISSMELENRSENTVSYVANPVSGALYPLVWPGSTNLDIIRFDGIVPADSLTIHSIEFVTPVEVEKESLHTYMLNIPRTFRSDLDSKKTEHQAIKIEYVEDCQNDKFIFWVFPSSKTHDVEILTIYKDGVVYKDDILLDLIRENIETNRVEIPFADVGETALLEFVTSGAYQAIQPVLLDRTKSKPIYTKDLSEIQAFKSGPAAPHYIEPSMRSTEIPYSDHGAYGYGDGKYGGTTDTDRVFGFGGTFTKDTTRLFKLSSVGNILLDGIKIVNVFDTFFYDDTNDMIVTSDTVTHIASFDPNVQVLYTEDTNEYVTEDKYNAFIAVE